MSKATVTGNECRDLVESLKVATVVGSNPSSKGRPVIQSVRITARSVSVNSAELVIVATDSYVLWEEIIECRLDGDDFDVLVGAKELKRTLTGKHAAFTIEHDGDSVTINSQAIIRTTPGTFPNYEPLFPNYTHDGSDVFALGEPAMRMMSVIAKQGHPIEMKALDGLKPIQIQVCKNARRIRALAMPVRIRS